MSKFEIIENALKEIETNYEVSKDIVDEIIIPVPCYTAKDPTAKYTECEIIATITDEAYIHIDPSNGNWIILVDHGEVEEPDED